MRNIIGTWLREGQPIRTLSYSKIDNAIPRLTFHVMWKGEPGDVIELSHRNTGMQLGTMKVRVGAVESNWAWE